MKGRVWVSIGQCLGRDFEGISKGMDGKWMAYIVQSQAELLRGRRMPGIRTRQDKNGVNKGKLAVDTSVRSVETY